MPRPLSPDTCTPPPPSARHYHPTLSIWLSVDPMADKYPSTSPYTYCANNPVRLVDPNGEDWYQNGTDYYWNGKVVNKETTPKGCTYIGDNDALIKHFGFPTSGSKSTKQFAQAYINSNMESNNPYEPKGFALGWVCAKAESSIKYTPLKEKSGKLTGIRIDATLNTAVSDYKAGGQASASLKVNFGNNSRSASFYSDEKSSHIIPQDYNSHRYKYASLTIPANKLSANCISKIEISGPWFNDGGPLYLPFTFTIVPRYLKHKYK